MTRAVRQFKKLSGAEKAAGLKKRKGRDQCRSHRKKKHVFRAKLLKGSAATGASGQVWPRGRGKRPPSPIRQAGGAP